MKAEINHRILKLFLLLLLDYVRQSNILVNTIQKRFNKNNSLQYNNSYKQKVFTQAY